MSTSIFTQEKTISKSCKQSAHGKYDSHTPRGQLVTYVQHFVIHYIQ